MASVYRYDGAGNDVSFINISGKISDCIDADWDQYILLRAGERVTPDLVPEASDIIYMRRIPRGTAVAITLGVVALVGAVGAGVYSYVQQKKINEYQEKLAENQKKMSAGSTVQKLPYVRGASNSPATGHSFPYILGETLFTPYKLCPDHISISGTDGADQYWYMVMECGFSSLCFRKMMLGTNKIISFSGDTPQSGTFSFDQGAYYDAGNFAEIRQTGNFTEQEFNRKVIYSNFMEEIPHRHIPSDATQQEAQEIEDEWRRGLVKQLPDHVMSVEVIIMFDGLRKFDEDDGAWVSASATLQVQWTNVDSPEESDWHDFDLAFNQNGTRSNSFSRNARKQLRYSTTQTFTPAQTMGKNVSVRIRRTTPKSSGTAKDTVYLMAVQSSIYDAEKSTSQEFVPAMPLEAPQRDKCTRIGIRIKSTSATDGYMDSFSVVQCGCCRTWDGSAWSVAKVPERNLAAWVLEILTSGIHEPSRYLDTELDLETFGEWYEYCEENGIYADGAVTDATAKKGLLEKLLANGNAALVQNETSGLMEVAVDSGRDYPVALLTSDNMISMTATKTVRRIADGVKVTYVNRDAGYEADSVTFMRDGGGYDPASDTLTTTALSYITDYTQAYRRAWRTMAEEIARPMSATVKVGQGGSFYRLFDCVDLQHDSLSIGLGHGIVKSLAWTNGTLSHIELAGFVDFPQSGRCGVIINCTSTPGVIPLEVSGTGRTSILTVVTELSENARKIPSPGDTLCFGLLDNDGGFSRITTRMLITDVSPDDDGYTLQLTEYNGDVYTYGTLPEYRSNITPRPESTKLSLKDVREYAELSDVSAAVTALEAGTGDTATPPDSVTGLSATAGEKGIELAWSAPGRGLKNSVQKYEIQITYDRTAEEPEWESAGNSKTNSFSFMFQRNVHGYPEADAFLPWAFRIRAVNIYNLASSWTTCTVNTSTYGTWILSVPYVDVKQDGRFVTLTMSQPPRSDGRMQYGDIRYGILIRRPDTDEDDVWWTPGTSGDPVHDVDAYRDVTHTYLERDTPYIQRLPLLSAAPPDEGYVMTQYQYRIVAINEKGYTAANYRDVSCIANFDNIRDFVEANAQQKEAIIQKLSALSANLGEITGGSFGGGQYNYWTLTTALNAVVDILHGNRDFQGAFQVGDDKQHIRVVPQVDIDGRTILGYEIEFKVGKFEISSTYSKLNGEFIIQENEDSLDRTRLTPIGTFFEYRDTKESDEWKLIAKQDTGGILSEQVYSNGTLLLSNAGIEARRNEGLDIGNPYLSSASRVYHFDTDEVDATRQLTGDVLDQNGQTGLTVSVASGGHAKEVGSEQGDQYRPAIQVKAPYSEIGNSLAGQFSLVHSLGSGTKWTVDFWFQYTWAEGQELFRATASRGALYVRTETSEPNYSFIEDGVPPYNTEEAESGAGIIPYNVARPDGCLLVYERNGTEYPVRLKDIGIDLKPDDWAHCAVTLDGGRMTVMLSNDAVVQRYLDDPGHEVPYVVREFTGAGTGGTFSYNPSRGTALIDELLVDATAAETATVFGEASVSKIPWGALPAEGKRLMLIKDEDAEFITNLNFAPYLELTDDDFEEIFDV